jgi:DHA2 family multidrug resistance protein
VWDDRAQLHQSRLAEASSAYSPALQQSLAKLQELGLNDTQSLGVINRTLVEQSYLLSTLDYFYASTFAAMALVLLVWFTRRPRIASGLPAVAE